MAGAEIRQRQGFSFPYARPFGHSEAVHASLFQFFSSCPDYSCVINSLIHAKLYAFIDSSGGGGVVVEIFSADAEKIFLKILWMQEAK